MIVKILTDADYEGLYLKKGNSMLVDDTLGAELIALGDAVLLSEYDVKLGTASDGVVATEEMIDGVTRKTILTIKEFKQAIAGAALGFGKELYTFPEGLIKVTEATIDLTIAGATETGTPDTGIGTVVASGAVDVLSGTATFEDIMDGFTATAISSAGSASHNYVSAEAGVLDGHTTAKKAFLNLAETWKATEDLTISGKVTLFWKHLGDY